MKAILIVATASTMLVSALGQVTHSESAERKELPTWAVKDLVRVGTPAAKPEFAWVQAPRSFLRSATRELEGPPTEWSVKKNSNYAGQGYTVITFFDKAGRTIICLAEEHLWTRLDHPAAVHVIDRVLHHLLRPGELSDREKVATYIQYASLLYRGPRRLPLTLETLHTSIEPYWDAWLGGTIKDAAELRNLCGDALVSRIDDRSAKLTCKLMTAKGAVEEWTLEIETSDCIKIKRITVRTLQEAGAFTYGLVG